MVLEDCFQLEINLTPVDIGIKVSLHPRWDEAITYLNSTANKSFKEFIQKSAEEYIRKAGLERVALIWKEFELTGITVRPGDSSGLDLLTHGVSEKAYYSHNVHTSGQAFALIATLYKYLDYIKSAVEELGE